MKLTEKIRNLEESRMEDPEESTDYGDYAELSTQHHRSSPVPAGASATGSQSEASKRVGNALFVLKGRNKRPKL